MQQASRDYDYGVGEKRIRSWKTTTVKIISDTIHPGEGEKLLRKHANNSGSKRTQEVVEENVRLYRNFLLNVKDGLRNRPNDMFSPAILEQTVNQPEANVEPGSNTGESEGSALMESSQQLHDRKVFIIFGKDELNSLRLEKLLRQKGLQNLVLLNTLSDKYQNLIEKLEQEARWDSCAIFVFTPEDFVRKTGSKVPLARPEFLFSMGWFCGKFGHQRVCVLSKKGAKLPSGLADFVSIEFEESVTDASATLRDTLRDLGFD